VLFWAARAAQRTEHRPVTRRHQPRDGVVDVGVGAHEDPALSRIDAGVDDLRRLPRRRAGHRLELVRLLFDAASEPGCVRVNPRAPRDVRLDPAWVDGDRADAGARQLMA
jgi:hypothetical protein